MSGSPAANRSLFYNLLPALYQVRDQEVGQPLAALLEVLQSQYDALSGNMEELYDDWFIATCQEWVVPYIGDLLAIPGIDAPNPWHSWRSLVGNTLAYRRRKGTEPALAHAARDASGWPAFPAVYQNTLGTTQSLLQVRPGLGGTADLRDLQALDDLHTPFNTLAHTARIASGPPVDGQGAAAEVIAQAAFNLALVGLYLWRLQSYPVLQGDACRVGSGRYTFHPLGIDMPLFNVPRTLTDPSLVPGPLSLPIRMSRHRLRSVLAETAAGNQTGWAWLADPPVVAVFLPGSLVPEVPPGGIFVTSLEPWRPPPPEYRVAVDPELGRLTLAEGEEADGVQVCYAYAFSGDVGGGPYVRTGGLHHEKERCLALVSRGAAGGSLPGWQRFSSLMDALAAWQASGRSGTILLAGSATWPVSGDWTLGSGQSLTLAAAEGAFPCLKGSLSVCAESSGQLTLDGLLLAAPLLLRGDIALDARDCTLNPPLPDRRGDAPPGLDATPGSFGAILRLKRCLCGPVRVSPGFLRLKVESCLIDGAGGPAIGSSPFPGHAPPLQIETSTLLGETWVQELSASASIFLGRVHVQLLETGGVTSSYVPLESQTPRQYRCQPSLALEGAGDPQQRRWLALRLRPVFTSTRYGHPGYGQLGTGCAPEIRTGTPDGAEMGVFHHLLQPQRRAVLAEIVEEYLPWNLNASFIDAT